MTAEDFVSSVVSRRCCLTVVFPMRLLDTLTMKRAVFSYPQTRMFMVLALLFVAGSVAGQTKSVLLSFSGVGDGALPYGGLIVDAAGNLYGTTYGGVVRRAATVFELNPIGMHTILHTFFGPPHDGSAPEAGLVRDGRGNLYGTTYAGGAFGAGTVFRVTASGHEKVLYSFTGGDDGGYPQAGLLYVRGTLYGTTTSGGPYAYSGGTVFKLSPDGTESTLYSFNVFTDGASPEASLIVDSDGNLYGTTTSSGAFGYGTVFEVASDGTQTTLYDFGSVLNDGAFPEGGLVRDSLGNFYGTTTQGGAYGVGTIFELTSAGEEIILHNFTGADGSGPYGSLVRSAKGNLFGTTGYGGSNRCVPGCGTIFELTPAGKFTSLRFTGGDGEHPLAGLVRDSAGNLYGTTSSGGAWGWGTVFKVTP